MDEWKKMAKSYVKTYYSKGYSLSQIKEGLVQFGYDQRAADKIVNEHMIQTRLALSGAFLVIVLVVGLFFMYTPKTPTAFVVSDSPLGCCLDQCTQMPLSECTGIFAAGDCSKQDQCIQGCCLYNDNSCSDYKIKKECSGTWSKDRCDKVPVCNNLMIR